MLEQSRTGSHSAVTNLYKNIPERFISYVIIQIKTLSLMYITARVSTVKEIGLM